MKAQKPLRSIAHTASRWADDDASLAGNRPAEPLSSRQRNRGVGLGSRFEIADARCPHGYPASYVPR